MCIRDRFHEDQTFLLFGIHTSSVCITARFDLYLKFDSIFFSLSVGSLKIFKKVRFTHPYFDQSALNFQSQLTKLQNKRNILFCGSYFGYGFHEDGIKSSIEMLKNLND